MPRVLRANIWRKVKNTLAPLRIRTHTKVRTRTCTRTRTAPSPPPPNPLDCLTLLNLFLFFKPYLLETYGVRSSSFLITPYRPLLQPFSWTHRSTTDLAIGSTSTLFAAPPLHPQRELSHWDVFSPHALHTATCRKRCAFTCRTFHCQTYTRRYRADSTHNSSTHAQREWAYCMMDTASIRRMQAASDGGGGVCCWKAPLQCVLAVRVGGVKLARLQSQHEDLSLGSNPWARLTRSCSLYLIRRVTPWAMQPSPVVLFFFCCGVVVAWCGDLQCVPLCCKVSDAALALRPFCFAMHFSLLQRVAVCHRMLQCDAVCGSVLQHVGVRYSVLQCVPMC